jgi:two-component system, sensor histidine kinase and response regulator
VTRAGDDRATLTTPPSLNPQAVERLKRLGGDPLARQMIELFLELGPARMDELASGLAAADAGRVERVAHSLKSAAGNVGAVLLQEHATSLEHAAGGGEIDAELAKFVVESWQKSAVALRRVLEGLSA